MSAKAEFGVFSPQAGMSFKALLDRATHMERIGYHSIWLVDHFWQMRAPDVDHHECLALLSWYSATRFGIPRC
jgi:hypothetical protein